MDCTDTLCDTYIYTHRNIHNPTQTHGLQSCFHYKHSDKPVTHYSELCVYDTEISIHIHTQLNKDACYLLQHTHGNNKHTYYATHTQPGQRETVMNSFPFSISPTIRWNAQSPFVCYNDQLCTYSLPAAEPATEYQAQSYTKFGNDPVNSLGRLGSNQ